MTIDPVGAYHRAAELTENLAAVRSEIASAAESSGRSADDVTLIAVTKTWPPSDIRLLTELGVADIAENKAQEFVHKFAEVGSSDVRWHFVGQLQRNKIKAVAPLVHMVHSVDRETLVDALNSQVGQLERAPLRCLVQVNLDPVHVEGRAGVTPADAPQLADQVAAAEHLELAGVMGVAPRGGDARRAFDSLTLVSRKIADAHSSATVISAGMSGDFAVAIAAGATHVRLGAVLLGERRILR